MLLSIKADLAVSNPNVTLILASWNTTTSPCQWLGVACGIFRTVGSESLGETRVTGVELAQSGLEGPIPDGFSMLPALQDLDLARNFFNETVPESLAQCNRLARLDLSLNRFNTSTFPDFLATLPALEALDLTGNSLNGSTLDAFVAGCSSIGGGSLTTLNVSRAGLAGEIPADIGRSCRNLQFLDLTGNSLAGGVPVSLGELPALQSLRLGANQLTGLLPPELFVDCGALRVLDLSFNFIGGPIPTELGNCFNLRLLNLQGNAFNGTLPLLFGNLSSLEALALGQNLLWGEITADHFRDSHALTFLEMHNNFFTGPHPAAVLGHLTNLETLALNVNPFDVATMPVQVAQLTGLRYLDLSHNQLAGAIPWQLSRLSKLDHLILAGNNLTGSIPAELGQLSELMVLDLSYNQLTGSVPASFGQLQELLWLGLTVNRLTGPLPPELGDCKSLLWFSAFRNMINGSIPDTYYRMGNRALERFQKNRLTAHLFPAYVGECSLIARWVPGELTEFIVEVLRHDKCKSYWNVILSGNAVVNPCSQIVPTQGYLELAYNRLSGAIPDSLGNATNLGFMFLQSNLLEGSIPDTLADLPLSKVNVSHNLLSGPIPASLGELDCLLLLDLSFNNLSGPIPASLSDLTLLTQFNVSYNVHLTGPVPTGPQFLTFGVDPYWADCGLSLGPVQGVVDPQHHDPPRVPLCDATWAAPPPDGGHGGHSAAAAARISPLAIAGISLAGTFGMLLLGACAICAIGGRGGGGGLGLWHKSSSLSSPQSEVSFAKVERDSQLFASRLKTHVSIFKMSLPVLTYEDLVVATNSFHDSNVLGSGGFGTVYKARLADGSVVAIKKLTQDGPQGIREFKAEMETLGMLKHENLVPLLGYCCFGRERILVYKCMKNGSLEEWLHEKEDGPDHLDWPKRLKIAIGTARGLDFLHNSCSPLIIHRDMKASNILLDDFFNAHVTDFGLARLMDVDDTHVSTTVAGTLGYVAPEYSQTWRATVKGDVYSFGVVLLELATGKRPVGVFSRDNRVGNLVEWVRLLTKQGRQSEALAPIVTGTGPCKDDLHKFLALAVSCCEEAAAKRPNMSDIVQRLQQMQGGPDHLLHDILEE